MASRQAGPDRDCIETLHHSKIKIAAPGTGRSAVLLNPDRGEVRRIQMDGCLAPSNSVSADWVVSKSSRVDLIVELKGRNVDHAVAQIEATWAFWRGYEGHCAGQSVGAWIVCSEYPRASTKVNRYRERFRARGGILLISTRNGEERDFAEFVPRSL